MVGSHVARGKLLGSSSLHPNCRGQIQLIRFGSKCFNVLLSYLSSDYLWIIFFFLFKVKNLDAELCNYSSSIFVYVIRLR